MNIFLKFSNFSLSSVSVKMSAIRLFMEQCHKWIPWSLHDVNQMVLHVYVICSIMESEILGKCIT